MKYEKDRQIFGIDEYKLMKMTKVLVFPAIALVLILIIVLMSGSGKDKDAAQSGQVAEQVTSATAASQESTQAESGDQASDGNDSIVKIGDSDGAAKTSDAAASQAASDGALAGSDSSAGDINDFTDYGLQSGAPEGVRRVIESYQKARLDGDAAAMYKLFGRLDTDGMDQLQANLDEEKKVFEEYRDTTYYSTNGIEADSCLVYVSTYVKFKGIDTAAPMLIWAYCVKGADGDYYMKEPDKLTQDEQALLDAVSASEDVRVLDNSMRTELAKAVVSDAKLAALYEIWSQGETD